MVTKENLGEIFEVALLNLEGEPLTKLIGKVKSENIVLGKKVLEFIENES